MRFESRHNSPITTVRPYIQKAVAYILAVKKYNLAGQDQTTSRKLAIFDLTGLPSDKSVSRHDKIGTPMPLTVSCHDFAGHNLPN